MKFNAEINIIGVNPYVQVPDKILQNIFRKSGKNKGAIPIKGTINGIPYKQTLIRYSGDWRLYINTTMLHHSPRRIGEIIKVSVEYDPEPRVITPHPGFKKELNRNKEAKVVFDHLPPSRRLEIVRYLANLKTEKALEINILRAINYLLGKERFVGRDKP
jgi:Bacteriocin-protection, YdeI or OmpD-Associated/Domain of unknown function (DUF1905)